MLGIKIKTIITRNTVAEAVPEAERRQYRRGFRSWLVQREDRGTPRPTLTMNAHKENATNKNFQPKRQKTNLLHASCKPSELMFLVALHHQAKMVINSFQFLNIAFHFNKLILPALLDFQKGLSQYAGH